MHVRIVLFSCLTACGVKTYVFQVIKSFLFVKLQFSRMLPSFKLSESYDIIVNKKILKKKLEKVVCSETSKNRGFGGFGGYKNFSH